MPTALLVIDVQQGLIDRPTPPLDHAGVIARINDLSRRARAARVPVIFIQHEDDYLKVGTATWALARGLHVEPDDLHLRKTATDSFHKTELQALLDARGITDLIICGMHTEFCVDTTTRRALALGYPVVLVSDAHTTEGNRHITAAQVIAHHNVTLSNIESFGPRARAIASADVLVSR
jgi:nicotinamidase-related amidase